MVKVIDQSYVVDWLKKKVKSRIYNYGMLYFAEK